MRKLILVLLLLPFFNDVTAQSYCPFDKDATWCFAHYAVSQDILGTLDYTGSQYTYFGEDTLINGALYTELVCPPCSASPNTPISNRTLLRDDTINKKVYWAGVDDTGLLSESLLFDFSLSVGDTIAKYKNSNPADGIIYKDTMIFLFNKMRRVLVFGCPQSLYCGQLVEGYGYMQGYNFQGDFCGPDAYVGLTEYKIDSNNVAKLSLGCGVNAFDVIGLSNSFSFAEKYCLGDTIQIWLNPPDKSLIECDTNKVLNLFGMNKFNDTVDIVIDTFTYQYFAGIPPARNFRKTFNLSDCGCLGIEYDLGLNLNPIKPAMLNDTVLCKNETVAIANLAFWMTNVFDTVYGAGVIPPNQFSGSIAGEGRHTIYFVPDSTHCDQSLDSITFNVLSASSLISFSDTIVCLGDTITSSYTLPSAGDSLVGPGVVNNTQIIASNAGFGMHTVLVYSNANNCNIVDSFQYEVLGPFTTTWIGLDSVCVNEPAFTVSANPSGGVFAGLTNNMTGLFDPQIAGAGTHLITYQYQSTSGCNAIDSAVVVVYDTTNTTFQLPFDSICSYELPVTLIGSPAGGVFSGQGVVGNQFNPALVSNLNVPIAIQYSFTNANGCSIDAIDSITVNLDTTFSAYFVNDSLCRGETGELKVFGNGMVWIDSTEQYTLIDSFSVNYSYNDIFNTPVKQVVFQDLNGCFDTLIVTAYIDKTTNPFANGELTICYLDSTEITLTRTNNITWAASPDIDNINDLTQTFAPLVNTVYQYQVINSIGCVINGEVAIEVEPCPIELPNAFSPNGDGVNDVWNIAPLFVYNDVEVMIFNRWGNEMFSSSNNVLWDGTHNGDASPDATYYYVVKIGDTKETLSGTVTIVR